MATLLHDYSILTWLWHDAALLSIESCIHEDGETAAQVFCELNSEEDQSVLFDLGLHTRTIKTIFRFVDKLKVEINGIQSSREVILSWDVSYSSSLLNQVTSIYTAVATNLVHHHIECSAGSSLDVICSEVWLEELL